LNRIEATSDEVHEFLECWQQLSPFPDVADALPRLHEHYQLIALSNGDAWFLEHLAPTAYSMSSTTSYRWT